MPLKLTPGMPEEGKISSLNRWADYIETQLRQASNFSYYINNKPSGSTIVPPTTTPSIVYRDHFHGAISGTFGGANSQLSIGELGWTGIGSISSSGGYLGGSIGHPGQYGISNSGTGSLAGWVIFNATGSLNNAQYNQNGLALGEAFGWSAQFIFKLEPSMNSNPQYLNTQRTIYIGFIGTTVSTSFVTSSSRPDVFMGVRFDTSTTSPSINDSFYTLEVVGNSTNTTYARNNTQGATQATTSVPTAGVWQSLTITSTVTGSVSLAFNDGTTLGTSMPTITLASLSGAGFAQNGLARASWTPSSTVPICPWGADSSVMISGFTSGRIGLNGTYALVGADNGDIWYPSSATIVNGSDTITLAGFPAFTPCFQLGNDDTGSPTLNSSTLFMDYFSLTS